MKKFFITIITFMIVSSAFAQKDELKFVDALSLNLMGKIEPTRQPYHRVDTLKYKGFNAVEAGLLRQSSGLKVCFRTNSTTIAVKAAFEQFADRRETMQISSSGFDLHIKKAGKWIYAASMSDKNAIGKPLVIIKNMDSSMKECLLYLPTYSVLESLEIGVDNGATIETLDDPFRHRIVIHGSSFTHGASTSRAGMTYPMQLERNTGLHFINVGVSGNCTMQQSFANLLAHAEADAFVFDCFSNPSAQVIEERLLPFIETIRKSHPHTPLIFLQTIVRESCNFDTQRNQFEQEKRDMAEKMMKIAMQKYPDVYFVNEKNLTGTDHLTCVDGTHPSDFGYYRWAQKIQPKLLKIFKKYGIK